MNHAETPAAVPADPNANSADLLADRVAETPDKVLFAKPSGNGWTDVTAAEFEAEVIALAKGLVAAGVEPGNKIGIMCRTRYEWSLIDFATWYAGAVLVPVYDTSSPLQVQWNLSDSGATAVFLETADHFARFDEVAADLPAVRNVWQIELGDLDKIVAGGTAVPDEEIARRRKLANADDLATIIYTSGSMGRPKGCVITHANFVELSRNSAVALHELVEDPRGASTLLFLPLAHVFARFIAVLSVHGGVRVGHQPDTRNLLPSLGSFKPSFLLAVPRVFEKVYNSAEQNAESGGKGGIFRKAANVAIEYSKAKESSAPVPFGLRMQYALYNRLVFSKLRAAMGGNVRFAVSGSAPLGSRLGHFFHSLGINVLEGYGLTETTAPATVNLPQRSKIGTVGVPLPGVSIRIAHDGEILVKGVDVFQEYWKNPEQTAASFEDGWFKTGDLGGLDDEGFLTITGRKKEIIVTAGGKNVAPAVLEDPIRANPLVSQVVVVGDQKPFIGCLITLDTEMLPVWLANNGHDATLSLEVAAKHPAVLAELQKAVDTANAQVSRAESIRKFVVLTTDFTEESGHLTPKLSIKRNVILKDFAGHIESLYSNAPATEGFSLR
ncbi:long-chain fatty acid--CoA ligase [Planctomonas sp. JC2975]|uniref:AMP-binding protein n=1 Tax=Planctomonas sp. JC2975 TaxID=2729626 RepID=UPI00147668E8|nr:long-chain fatty acid--CoA ligase [Planctomonas sp. JC2975]